MAAIFGVDIIQHFRRKRPAGWIDLMATFESRKRTASPYRESSISVPLPYSFIEFFKKCRVSRVILLLIIYYRRESAFDVKHIKAYSYLTFVVVGSQRTFAHRLLAIKSNGHF